MRAGPASLALPAGRGAGMLVSFARATGEYIGPAGS